MLVYNLIDGYAEVGDVGMLALLVLFLVDVLDGKFVLERIGGDILAIQVLPELQ